MPDSAERPRRYGKAKKHGRPVLEVKVEGEPISPEKLDEVLRLLALWIARAMQEDIQANSAPKQGKRAGGESEASEEPK